MLLQVIFNANSTSTAHSNSTLQMENVLYVFQAPADKRRVVKLLKKGYSLMEAVNWKGELPAGPQKEKAAKAAAEEEIREYSLPGEEQLEILSWEDQVKGYWQGDHQWEEMTPHAKEIVRKAKDWEVEGHGEELTIQLLEMAEEMSGIVYEQHIPWCLHRWSNDLLEFVLRVKKVVPEATSLELDAGYLESLYKAQCTDEEMQMVFRWTLYYSRTDLGLLSKVPEWVYEQYDLHELDYICEELRITTPENLEQVAYQVASQGWDSTWDYLESKSLDFNREEYYSLKDEGVDMYRLSTFEAEQFLEHFYDLMLKDIKKLVEVKKVRAKGPMFSEVEKTKEYKVNSSTEVIPFPGQIGIACSSVEMSQDSRWDDLTSKIWASTGGVINSYGEHANLLFINTHKGLKESYRTGSWKDSWAVKNSWGVDPTYEEGLGAISYENSLTEKVVYMGPSNQLPNQGSSGEVTSEDGRKGWFESSSRKWSITFEDGQRVTGERGIPEAVAYLKGYLKTEAEKGLPLAALFATRLILIGVAAYKGRKEDGRSAGYRWLGHYALGTGMDKKMPKKWVEPFLCKMLEKADSNGRVVWNSSDWMDQSGFNGQPAGFYTVGGFIGHIKEGKFSFVDRYDWHPMQRTSPRGLGSAKMWCWSEVEGMDAKIEHILPYVPKVLYPLAHKVVKKWGHLNVAQALAEILGPQYVGDSEFFGISGISNKLWHDLEAVGARPFNTVFETKI